jgi:hypothetical protein
MVVQAISVGLMEEEQRYHHEELQQSFKPSRTSEIHARHGTVPQPEIVLVSCEESAAPSPQHSADESNGDVRVLDPDDSGLVQMISCDCSQIVDSIPAPN